MNLISKKSEREDGMSEKVKNNVTSFLDDPFITVLEFVMLLNVKSFVT